MLFLVVVTLAAGTLLGTAAARTGAGPANVGWGGFGNTPDEQRHSPLTQINTTNLDACEDLEDFPEVP